MNLIRAIFMLLWFGSLAVGPVYSQGDPPRLPPDEAGRIADAYASRRPDFREFRTRCFFSSRDYWNILYVRKGPDTPDHFSIRVSHKTKRAWLAPED